MRLSSLKVVKANISGVPDICGVYKSIPIYFEVKKEKGVMSRIQKVRASQIIEAGGKFFLVRSVEAVSKLIT